MSRPNFAFSPPLGDHFPSLCCKAARECRCAARRRLPSSRANRLLELLEFFDHDDDRLAELAAEQRDANEGAILVAVADDEALRVLVHRERGDQFRFAARFESEMKLLAGVDDFFDHFAQLIDLDRENAAIMILDNRTPPSRFETRG